MAELCWEQKKALPKLSWSLCLLRQDSTNQLGPIAECPYLHQTPTHGQCIMHTNSLACFEVKINTGYWFNSNEASRLKGTSFQIIWLYDLANWNKCFTIASTLTTHNFIPSSVGFKYIHKWLQRLLHVNSIVNSGREQQ